MKRVFIAFLFALAHAQAGSQVLDTRSFTVNIEVNCPEGAVSCDDVIYIGKNKKSGKTIRLKGQTWHTLCADGVTPCRFMGYKFASGRFSYLVTDTGTLTVSRGRRTLIEEQGSWQE
jgi:hypothetical protein